jgi:hypothetical protein
MPRYLVERVFPGRFPAEEDDPGYAGVVTLNAELGVTWVQSYLTDDERRSVCVCDAPSPEAIRRAASRYRWPVDTITKVSVINPCQHHHNSDIAKESLP